jgi:septal ring factor EnvC (AmiA/AmiB activator)
MPTETSVTVSPGIDSGWPEAARTLMGRLRLTRQKANNGKALVSVDRGDASLKARIEELEAQLAKAQASTASHRADFERERERCDRLTLELIRAAVETMNAKEAAARLEGELNALRSRRWRQRFARHSIACDSWIAALLGHVKLNKTASLPAHAAQSLRISAAPE